MIVVFGLGMRLCMHMCTQLAAENSQTVGISLFIDVGKCDAIMTLIGHRAKIMST